MKKKLILKKETVAALKGYRGGLVQSNDQTCNNGGLECLKPPTTKPTFIGYTCYCPEEPDPISDLEYMCGGSDYPGCIS